MKHYKHKLIKGLYYIPNYITNEESKEILEILKESNYSKVGAGTNSRRVIHHGYNYSYNNSSIEKIGSIPKYFANLVKLERLNDYFIVPLLLEEFDQLIINEYTPGQGIAPHIDSTKFFNDVIVCITVSSGTSIEFSKDDASTSVYVNPNSLYIMTGEARYLWKHAIKARLTDNDTERKTRYSLTYRTVIK